MPRPKHKTCKRAVVRTETVEEAPSVWLSQLKDGVNYGVRDYGRLGRRATDRAMAEFLRLQRFVEVEVPRRAAALAVEAATLVEATCDRASSLGNGVAGSRSRARRKDHDQQGGARS